MPGVVTFIRGRVLLLLLTGAFAALALDITVPAVVLSLMALSRWFVSMDMDLAELEGKAA
ncbi:membrane protein [Neorhizobium sp. NCHU2750]|nr:membrane protein [Neorhizobium sp. NCHU2750]